MFFDQPPGAGEVSLRGSPRIRGCAEEEPCPVQVNVRHKQRHGAALGDFPGLVKVALRALGAGAAAVETPQPGPGEQAAGKNILVARAAEAGHGKVNVGEVRRRKPEVRLLQNGAKERGAAQGEVVEGDVEEAQDAARQSRASAPRARRRRNTLRPIPSSVC